jgi:hypothetical protein
MSKDNPLWGASAGSQQTVLARMVVIEPVSLRLQEFPQISADPKMIRRAAKPATPLRSCAGL